MRNQGDGTFGEAKPLDEHADLETSLPADFNGDRYPDLAAVKGIWGRLITFSGNASGSFSRSSSVPTGLPEHSSLHFFGIGDFDGNRTADLIIARGLTGDVTVHLGNGNGTFGRPWTVHIYGIENRLLVGDLDDDGKDDFLPMHDYMEELIPYLSNGDGTFRAGEPMDVSLLRSAPSAVLGDFNEDGRADLALAYEDGNKVKVFLGQGGGRFLHAPINDYRVGGAAPFNHSL